MLPFPVPVERLGNPHGRHVEPDARHGVRLAALAIGVPTDRVGTLVESEFEAECPLRILWCEPGIECESAHLVERAVEQVAHGPDDRAVAEHVENERRVGVLGPEARRSRVDEGARGLVRGWRQSARAQVEPIAVAKEAELAALQVEDSQRPVRRRTRQVDEERAARPDDLDGVAADDGGAVLLDAQPERVAARLQQGQHAADPAAPEKVLVDEQVGADEIESAIHFRPVAQGAPHHRHHVDRIPEHRAARGSRRLPKCRR